MLRELAEAVNEVLLGLEDNVVTAHREQYRAYQRLRITLGSLHRIRPAASAPRRSRTRCWSSVRWSISQDR